MAEGNLKCQKDLYMMLSSERFLKWQKDCIIVCPTAPRRLWSRSVHVGGGEVMWRGSKQKAFNEG